jgi:hypothetical protein
VRGERLDAGDSAPSQAVFYTSAFFRSDGVPPPAPAPVTQTVSWHQKDLDVHIFKEIKEITMEYNRDKVDEVILALLYLNFLDDQNVVRAWKSFDWDAMDRLHEKGYISDPKSKAKSVVVTEEGQNAAKELFVKFFCP